MTNAMDLLRSDPRAVGAVLLLALGYLLLGYWTLSPGHVWGDDWAQYVNHARNLANGRAYSDTGYLFNPNEPHVGPPSYSPGLPLLLAPIVKLWGLDIIALKSVSLVCMTAAILMTFVLFQDSLGARVAAGGTFLFGLHEFAWSLRDYIVSEPPYILWTLIALYLASRPVHNRGIATGVLCGLFTCAAFLTRPIGMALVIAVLVCEVTQRGLYGWRFFCMAGIPVVGVVLQRHFIPLANYSAELHAPTLAELAGNVAGYWKATGDLFPLGRKLSLLSPLAVVGFALLGIRYRLRSVDIRVQPSIRHLPMQRIIPHLRTVLARIPVEVWYSGLYLAALVMLPLKANARYLVPILPILSAYVVYAISCVVKRTPYARFAVLVFCSACLCYYATVYWTHRVTPSRDDALCDDCRAMYSFIRDHTEPNGVVAFAKPRVMALLADRPAWVWTHSGGEPLNWGEFKSTGVNYIVLVPPIHPLAPTYPAQLDWNAWRSNPKLSLVYENQTFRVVRFMSRD